MNDNRSSILFFIHTQSNLTDLYWFGVNKELFLSAIYFHGNPLAQFLTQTCRFLPAVIELSP